MADRTIVEKIGNFISKSAPLLGQVIPIPGAEPILKMIGAAFGASDENDLLKKLASNLDAAVKLIEIQSNTQVQLQQILANQAAAEMQYQQNMYGYEVQDRTSARQSKEWMTDVLAIVFVGLFAFFKYFMITHPKYKDDGLSTMLTELLLLVAYFYFGSSRGSRLKDMMRK